MTEAINDAGIANLLATNVGAHVTGAQIRAAFDAAFGAGAGDRVQIACTGDGPRTLIVELKVALQGTITPGLSLGELILAADPQSPGCSGGIVDPVGLQ